MTFYRNKIFPVLAGGLWAIFLFLDITNTADSTWVKFAAICLCCITALLGAHTVDGQLVAAALCLTVGADWFLLVRNDHYLLGIGLFIVVQLIYAYRLCLHRGKVVTGSIFVRLLALGAAVLIALRGEWVAAFSVFCFATLSVNVWEGYTGIYSGDSLAILRRPLRNRFGWGLFLFGWCDLCVGLYNLSILTAFTRIGIWLFYLPSQVLIVLSQEQEKGDLDEKAF